MSKTLIPISGRVVAITGAARGLGLATARLLASRGARVAMMMALAVTAWMSAVLAAGAGGLLGYHGRNVYGMTPAPWLGWANTVVELAEALPAFGPQPAGTPLGARMAAARDGFVSRE